MAATSAPRLAQGLTPQGAIAPPMRMLFFPLNSASGTGTSDTTPSGFARRLKVTGTTRDDPLTLTINSGSVSIDAEGGLVVASGANFFASLDPAPGDAFDFLQAIFDLSAYGPGQTLMFGCEVVTPSGWLASLTGTVCIASVGGFGASDGGGLGFSIASNGRPAIVWRAVGASAVGATIVNLVGVDSTDNLIDSARHAVIFEFQCTDADTFKVRGHLSNTAGTTYTGDWSAEIDLSDPANSGTAAPGPVSGAGFRIGGRKDGTGNQFRLSKGETLRNVWAAQFDAPPRESIGPKICADMLLRKGCRARTLTFYDEDAVDIEDSPDGTYDAGFSPVTLGDIFVAFDGKRAITDHPQFTIIAETSTTKGSNKSTNIDVLNPKWVSTADYEGTERIAADPGGLKFARTELAPASAGYPSFLFSSYPTDQSNRSRAEAAWRGPDVTMPFDEVLWIAMRVWYDFEMGGGTQHVTCSQIYHGGVNAGINPFYGVNLYEDRISIEFRWCDIEGMTKADQQLVTYRLDGKPDEVRGRWVDMVAKLRLDWNPAGSGFVQFWIDDEQVIDYTGPIGYRGPAVRDGQLVPLAPEMRFGNYPGSVTTWTPDLPRDFYIRRAFVCRNVGNYTLSQIRAALSV